MMARRGRHLQIPAWIVLSVVAAVPIGLFLLAALAPIEACEGHVSGPGGASRFLFCGPRLILAGKLHPALYVGVLLGAAALVYALHRVERWRARRRSPSTPSSPE